MTKRLTLLAFALTLLAGAGTLAAAETTAPEGTALPVVALELDDALLEDSGECAAPAAAETAADLALPGFLAPQSLGCISCTPGQPPRCPNCGSGCPGFCNGACCDCAC